MSVRKRDLAWALLDPAVGHEQAGRRPVLIFCNDVIAPPIGIATVLPLTTWKKDRRVQVRTISARRLSPAIGTLGDGVVREQVVRALRLWLDLTGD